VIPVYFISIGGISRTPVSTRKFIEIAQGEKSLFEFGVNLSGRSEAELDPAVDTSVGEYLIGGPMSLSEIGCALSHQKAYQHMIQSGYSSVIVLEDDAELLISPKELSKLVLEWEKSSYELINLYSKVGGVLLGRRRAKILKNLVPAQGAIGYWLTLSGAKKLYSQPNKVNGLADWPWMISNLKIGSSNPSIIDHAGKENSTILNSLPQGASNRPLLFYRSVMSLFKERNFREQKFLRQEYGVLRFLYIIIIYRSIRRLGRILTRTQPGLPDTYRIIF
jgi:GR25 family glycosyltransferase involved in LPS biosynthesis